MCLRWRARYGCKAICIRTAVIYWWYYNSRNIVDLSARKGGKVTGGVRYVEFNICWSACHKSLWRRRKVDDLGHRVSLPGLDAHPKDLEFLVNIPFPQTLRSMQTFLGSLNFYSRLIENFAIYASVLYVLHEADFHEITFSDKLGASKSKVGDNNEYSPKTGTMLIRTIAIHTTEVAGRNPGPNLPSWKIKSLLISFLSILIRIGLLW